MDEVGAQSVNRRRLGARRGRYPVVEASAAAQRRLPSMITAAGQARSASTAPPPRFVVA
jgi:hypothetical protein